MSWRNQLERAITGQEEAISAFAQDLIRIPSENPPGNRYPECIGRVAQELDRLGLAHQVIPAPGFPGPPRSNLLAFCGEGGRTLYFHGHCDVVPAQSPEQFQPRIRDGVLHGRGSADMKAGLAAMIYAAWLLRELGAPVRGRIGLCVVVDEETGGLGGSRCLQEAGLLGQGGVAMLTPEPTSGVVWNANRGAVTLRVTVLGRSAHVGLQHQGVNAFEGMVEVVRALQTLKAEVERRRTGYRIEPAAAANSILMLGGRVEGGTNFNVVPERCSFTLERRFNPEEDFDAEKARLLEVLDEQRRRGIGSSNHEKWSAIPAGSARTSRRRGSWPPPSKRSPAGGRSSRCARGAWRSAGTPGRASRPSPTAPDGWRWPMGRRSGWSWPRSTATR